MPQERQEAKHIQVREQLRQLAMTLQPGEALPTILAIRERFNVSQPTVDRALQALKAEGLVELRRGQGIFVTDQVQRRQIGLCFSYDVFAAGTGQFPRALVEAIQSEAEARGWLLRYYLPRPGMSWQREHFETMLIDMRGRQLHGLIAVAVPLPEMSELAVPVVGLGRLPYIQHSVVLDHCGMIEQGIQALAAAGCRQIALLNSGVDDMLPRQLASFHEAVMAAGLSYRPEWIRRIRGGHMETAEAAGTEAFGQLWDALEDKPDGLLSCCEYATAGVIRAASARGIQVNHDLRIASHATVGADAWSEADATALLFDPKAIGEALLNKLGALMAGADEPAETFVPAIHKPVALARGNQ